MIAASLVAWLWMAAQSGNLTDSTVNGVTWNTSKAYVQIFNDASGTLKARDSDGNEAVLPVRCDPLNPESPYWTNCHVTPAPAEHVIEIRTRRGIPDVKCVARYKALAGPAWLPDIADIALHNCTKSSREIYVDGVKFGVLKETDSQ